MTAICCCDGFGTQIVVWVSLPSSFKGTLLFVDFIDSIPDLESPTPVLVSQDQWQYFWRFLFMCSPKIVIMIGIDYATFYGH